MRLRFSLRSLFVLVTLVALLAAGLFYYGRVQNYREGINLEYYVENIYRERLLFGVGVRGDELPDWLLLRIDRFEKKTGFRVDTTDPYPPGPSPSWKSAVSPPESP